MEVLVYTFEDAEGSEFGSYSTQKYQEAVEYAMKGKLKVICNVFEFADSYMVDDFTEKEEKE